MSIQIRIGDCRDVLKTLPDESVHCCVTSPPYFGLRDYGVAGQIGLEPTPDTFIAEMVAVFRAVRRVLRKDGTCWLNLGDSYASSQKGSGGSASSSGLQRDGRREEVRLAGAERSNGRARFDVRRFDMGEAKPKDLLMMPARVALALQADGWWLRSHIIWHKPNPMPESVTDRPTSAHESVFLLTKAARYWYDADAVREDAVYGRREWIGQHYKNGDITKHHMGTNGPGFDPSAGRNLRNVWTIPSAPYSGAHFATFPPALIDPCIKAGCPAGGTVLDPFGGAGTTGLVADRLGRNAILIELNPEYAGLADNRIVDDLPLFSDVVTA